jgi:hypothetical protein
MTDEPMPRVVADDATPDHTAEGHTAEGHTGAGAAAWRVPKALDALAPYYDLPRERWAMVSDLTVMICNLVAVGPDPSGESDVVRQAIKTGVRRLSSTAVRHQQRRSPV